MKRTIIILCLCTLCFLPLLVYAQKAVNDITGIWYNAEKDAKIEITKTGNTYTGKVIWLKYPNDASGKPKTDVENSDPRLRKRPRLGLTILTGLEHKSGSKYEKGKIYDPKNGKTYSCQVELANPDLLKLRGYIGVSLIGRTSEWTRAK